MDARTYDILPIPSHWMEISCDQEADALHGAFAACEHIVAENASGQAIDTVELAMRLLAQNSLGLRMFGDVVRQPAWEMLLRLYVAKEHAEEITARDVCASSGESLATACWWLGNMQKSELVTRSGRSMVGDEALVEITADAAAKVKCLLQNIAADSGFCVAEASP